MSLTGIDFERVGFWGLLILYIVRDGLLPVAGKWFPSRIKMGEREQDREDKRMEFEHQMELRHVEALEAINKVLAVMNERLSRIESRLQKKKNPVT
jgi:hypothetical protein